MRQRNLITSTTASMAKSSGRVESQYFVGSASPSGHFDDQPFERMRRGELRRLHAHRVGEPQRCDASAERAVAAVAGVGQHDASGHAGLHRGFDLRKRYLRLGLELHILGNMRFFTALGVPCPSLGEIEPIGDPRVKPEDQAHMMIGDGARHRALAIVGLAQLTPRYRRHAG
jgi:hypothetical protein